MDVIRRIECPVFAQFFGAQYQHPLISQFKEFDHCQRRVGLSQPHAVGEDAAIVSQQTADNTSGSVFLKTVQRFPNLGIVKVRILQLAFVPLSIFYLFAEQLV